MTGLERLQAAGFEVVGTGGNCTALSRIFRHDGHEWQVLVTDELNAPESIENPLEDIVVSCEIDEQYDGDFIAGMHNADDVMCAIVQLLLDTTARDCMGYAIDYTLSEIWPDWHKHVTGETE